MNAMNEDVGCTLNLQLVQFVCAGVWTACFMNQKKYNLSWKKSKTKKSCFFNCSYRQSFKVYRIRQVPLYLYISTKVNLHTLIGCHSTHFILWISINISDIHVHVSTFIWGHLIHLCEVCIYVDIHLIVLWVTGLRAASKVLISC